jgi:predicted enzyme related to lactoylglutathione lyase
MSIKSIGAVLLFSDHPDQLVTFYRDVVGLPLTEEKHPGAPLHWGCQVGNVHFAIHSSKLNKGKPGVAFSLLTPSFQKLLSDLESKGKMPGHAPIPMGGGARRSTIQDPDGNLISLVEPAREWVTEAPDNRHAVTRD